ncbi:ComEA family DNA-binding protein [Rothia uropygioeca]|uniref:ComEA family DNA-binding protein n=1 Tax=Kocuria sp. 257 TaxID=2021970 RepID=UPI0010127F9D|nr:helix-hairpin-helix domain-containing protein [Kocuria sp. 257]
MQHHEGAGKRNTYDEGGAVLRRRTLTARRIGSPEARERLNAMIARSRDRLSAEGEFAEDEIGSSALGPEVTKAEVSGAHRAARVRFSPSPRALAGVLVLAVLGILVALLVFPRAGAPGEVSVMVSGTASPLDPDRISAAGADGQFYKERAADNEGDASTDSVMVHVVGAVARPGLVRVPQGSLTNDAIQAAGGPAPDAALDSLNLAEPVRTGQQIKVLSREEAEHLASGTERGAGPEAASGSPGANGSAAKSGPTASGKIDLNRATVNDLQTLPKVGPKLAQRIVDWRTEHGPFRSTTDLDAVPGIGPTLMQALEPLVTV